MIERGRPVGQGDGVRAVRVRVPATSANLGPGFDAFGLALTLYDDVVVRLEPDGGGETSGGSGAGVTGVQVDVRGEGADEVPRDEGHLVARAVTHALAGDAERLSGRGLRLRCTNLLPHGRGLGSSAAAIVAGVLAGLALAGRDVAAAGPALQLATALEGHPDNVAAALLGGGTLAWTDETGLARAVPLEVHADVVPVVLVPPARLATKAARALLPRSVPHADAAANAARAALLVEALARRPDLLHEATADRLHQAYRAPAMPESAHLVDSLRADGLAAVISGAGPSVLVLTTASPAEAVAARAPAGWRGLVLGVDRAGAQVQAVADDVPDAVGRGGGDTSGTADLQGGHV